LSVLPKKAFDDHKRHSEARGIPFLFTYAEWLEMWLVSGKWHLRGKKSGNYVMARFNDEGAYSPRNCKIITSEENQSERWKDKKRYPDGLVLEIRELWKNTTLSQREIGEKYNICQSYVSRIISGDRRKSLGGLV